MIDRLIYKLLALKSFYDKDLPATFPTSKGTIALSLFTLFTLFAVTACSTGNVFKTKTLSDIMLYESNRFTCNSANCYSKYELPSPACRSTKKPLLTLYKMERVANNHGYKQVTYDVPVIYNKRVEWYLGYFTGKGHQFFTKWLERSGKYIPTIKKILKEEGVPLDLAYVALIESGFNHKARSHASAVGTWQFIKSTAHLYDLRVDWWVDERHDFEKSTVAAARFLKHLHGKFGSWEMALAAYNAGEGRMRKASRLNDSNNYWVITKNKRTLKLETRDYVPKFIAAMMIAKNPEKYGFHNLKYHSPVNYDSVYIKQPTDIKVIAKASESSLSEIQQLNPSLKRWYTPESSGSYQIRIPKGTKKVFTKNFALVPKDKLLEFKTHKVKSGESLWSIARYYKTQIHRIVKINNLKRKKVLREGITIMVPVRRSGYTPV